MKPNYKSGAFRYSNYPYVVDLGTEGDYTELPADYYSGNGSGNGSGSASGSSFNWSDFFSNLFSSATSISTSIWGHNNQWQAQAYNTMYEQERRTNTILWVVIGLVVALGVFLVVRKTK